MQIKTFRAKTMPQVLDLVRRGLVTRQQATGYAKDKKIFD